MATPSSILRNAATAQQRAREFDDSLAAYAWDNSTKTYADYVDYAEYLNTRRSQAGDPAAQLSYQKKIDAARSAFISNDVQRQSIDVIEGGSSNIDKYNRMLDLYYYAADAGQNELAQSMRLQLDNLSVTIQNEQKARISANKEAANEMTKAIDAQVSDAVAQVKDNAKYALEQYSALGPQKFQEATGSDIFSMLANMVNSQDPNNPGLVQIYAQAAQITPDPAKARDYQLKFNGIAEGESTGIKLPGVGNVTYQDLAEQAYAVSIGQTLFETITTAEGVEFARKATTGYQWGRDENGQYKLMPIYNSKQDFKSSFIDTTKDNKQLTYADLLKQSKFEVVQAGEGNLIVRNNGEFDKAGVARGQQVELYVDQNGNLQAVTGPDKAYTLSFDNKTGEYRGLQAQAPQPINLLGDQFNNRFLSTVDRSKLPGGTIGIVDTTSPYAKFMEAGPLGQLQAPVQHAASILPPATAIQAPQQNFQNTTTGQSIISAPANATVSIANPQPLPQINLPTPKPLPTVSTAVNPQPAPKVTVSSGAYSGPGIRF